MSAEPMPVRLSLVVVPVGDPGSEFPVTARFVNVSGGAVRLLAQFEPLPVFFTPELVSPEGAPIDVAGAGKADFAEGALQYVEVAAGGRFDAAIDLSPWIRDVVTPGRYRLALTYHNAYGRDCFRGPLKSDRAFVEVTGRS